MPTCMRYTCAWCLSLLPARGWPGELVHARRRRQELVHLRRRQQELVQVRRRRRELGPELGHQQRWSASAQDAAHGKPVLMWVSRIVMRGATLKVRPSGCASGCRANTARCRGFRAIARSSLGVFEASPAPGGVLISPRRFFQNLSFTYCL